MQANPTLGLVQRHCGTALRGRMGVQRHGEQGALTWKLAGGGELRGCCMRLRKPWTSSFRFSFSSISCLNRHETCVSMARR